MKFGTTYSHRRIRELGLSHELAFQMLLSLNFDTVRLCTYWDEVQPTESTYNLSLMKSMLDACEKHHQNVVLTIGMKAPRWPEFYVPHWIKNSEDSAIVKYCQRIIRELRQYTCIAHWQIENEPLDPSGPDNRVVPLKLLIEEVQSARQIDNRPMMITLWGNELSKRNLLPKVINLADVIGIDIYYTQPTGKLFVSGPKDSDKKLCDIIGNCAKPVWITELQAEPWGRVGIDLHQLQSNVERAQTLGCEQILLWGFEYWYNEKLKGNNTLWNYVSTLKH